MIIKPMLASTVEDVNSIKYPVLASRKLDGIRCLVLSGESLSRKFKPIPNLHIRSTLHRLLYDHKLCFDGELTVGDTFHSSSSGVMSESGTPDFVYSVFDVVHKHEDQFFEDRYALLVDIVQNRVKDPRVRVVKHELIKSADELSEYEAKCLAEGYEGVMIRAPQGHYKNGRSTLKEGLLLKVKQFSDFEAKIIGFEEKLHNANEATLDELGHTKRSSHKENMVPLDTLGSLILQSEDGTVFKCGTGFDDAKRKEIWSNRDSYMGKIAKIKSQEAGKKDKPRFPVYLGIRHPDDM
jgi:DNA ligase-1